MQGLLRLCCRAATDKKSDDCLSVGLQADMHRFFAPAGGAMKKPRLSEDVGSCESGPVPRSFLSLNVNGLFLRVEQKEGGWMDGVGDLVRRLEPDVIAMQEVKLTAKAPKGAKRGDGAARERDKPHDNDSKNEWQTVKRNMLEKDPWCHYTQRFSCADWRYAGTLTLFKKGLRAPEKLFYNLDLDDGRHDENGRVCIAQYSTGLRVANFYAPNNGWNEKSNFAARRAWDEKLLGFVRRTHEEQRELVVIGDLNVAHQDADVSHPDWFLAQTEKFRKGAAGTGETIADNDKGQPGFTRNERLRFSQVLGEGQLVDTWRQLHPEGVGGDMNDANWSWRGSEHQTDKYHARGMRIDYCLVSKSICARVQEAVIIGKGIQRREGFWGSDHSPVFLRLAVQDPEPGNVRSSPDPGSSPFQTAGADRDGKEEKIEPKIADRKARPPLPAVEHDPNNACGPCFVVRLSEWLHEEDDSEYGRGEGGEEELDAFLQYDVDYQDGQKVMIMSHTSTPEHLQGKGIAAHVTRAAFEYCRENRFKVHPTMCTYIRDNFLKKNPEFSDLVLPCG